MIKLMEMVKYRHIRPFTKVEMNQITDEYLNNNKFKEVMPEFAKDKDTKNQSIRIPFRKRIIKIKQFKNTFNDGKR